MLYLHWVTSFFFFLFFFSARSIISRRFFCIVGTLYLYRCITMYVTTLPVPGMHFKCSPKVNFLLPFFILIFMFSPCPTIAKTVSSPFAVIATHLKHRLGITGGLLSADHQFPLLRCWQVAFGQGKHFHPSKRANYVISLSVGTDLYVQHFSVSMEVVKGCYPEKFHMRHIPKHFSVSNLITICTWNWPKETF